MRLESVGSGSGSTAYIPGLAADAASTAAGLSTHRPSSPREVRALRPHGPPHARSRSLTVATAHRSRRHGMLTSRPRRPRLIRPCSPRFRRV
jgi:hypothetical protein